VESNAVQWTAAVLFGIALVHTFASRQIDRLSHRFPRHAGVFHLLGEVEVVFGLWAIVLVAVLAALAGGSEAVRYAESRHYGEALFVFVVMVVAASRPVLYAVMHGLLGLTRLLPVRPAVAQLWLGLALGPLLGSLITEPAAMTISALVTAPLAFRPEVPERLKYAALGVLFVNVSIGGTLTAYAAPPVLMVAETWGWDSWHMLRHFGWKSALAVVINATVVTWALRRHLPSHAAINAAGEPVPMTVVAVHLLFLAGVVAASHHPVIFLGLFAAFLGFTMAYERYQSPLIIREALLVGFFLAGLVVLGGLQEWWLQPVVSSFSPLGLFFGATALTAITDNAALTYLGSLIEGLPEAARHMLVAGAVAGGGLTVIANAPNPAGVALLKRGFRDESVGAGALLLGALPPTLVAMAALLLP
jgi:hypothetical protein